MGVAVSVGCAHVLVGTPLPAGEAFVRAATNRHFWRSGDGRAHLAHQFGLPNGHTSNGGRGQIFDEAGQLELLPSRDEPNQVDQRHEEGQPPTQRGVEVRTVSSPKVR